VELDRVQAHQLRDLRDLGRLLVAEDPHHAGPPRQSVQDGSSGLRC